MSNLRAREDFRRAFNVQARIIGFPLVALGLLSIVSGALGLDFWNRFFTGGAFGLNDLVPGVVLLGTAVAVFGPLLPQWLHYGLGGAIALMISAGALLWPRSPDRSVRS
jgi:hypothetical protein